MQVGPSWSPDGRHLAYYERVVGDGDYSEATDLFRVQVVDPEGGDGVDVTRGQPLLIQPGGGFWGLSWSTDSRRLAFAIQGRDPGTNSPRSTIMVANADGSGIEQLGLDVDARDPTWQPGDRLLAFSVHPEMGSTAGVWTVRPDGTSAVKVTSSVAPGDGYAFTAPSWSPSGMSLAYGCCAGPHDLWTVDIEGTEHRITTDPVDEYWPTWSSTGQIAFHGSSIPRALSTT
jgi:Tol biopolymer transport system component